MFDYVLIANAYLNKVKIVMYWFTPHLLVLPEGPTLMKLDESILNTFDQMERS